MKRILSICLILLAPVMVFAQAGLPPCQETHSQIRWDGCWGSFRLWNGSRIEGEFRDGELTGFGIESSSDGKTIRAGRWRAWSFVEAVPLEKISLPQAYFLARDQAAREFLQQLTSLSGGSWRDRLDRAIQNSLRQWPLHGSQDLVEVPPPAYPAALVLKQEPWETNAEFEGRLEKARTDRRTAIDRLESEYRTKVEERNRRVADFNKTRREREESLPQRRRTLVLLGLGALAPRVALSDAALDQQSGSLTVAVRVEDLEQQIFAFAGTSQDFRRIALTEPQNLRAKPEFEVTDKGEITLRAVSLEVGAATARGLPAAGPASQLQLATVTLPQIQSGPLPQQSAVAVDRNQVEQILYREENESLRRRLEEQRRQQEQAVANAEARASAEIARLKAEADALRSQPGQSRPSPALASVREAHALVIGNSAYPGSSRLANPVNDARAMAAKLRSLGFRVTEVPNATREQLVRGLSDFTRTAAQADLTLLFYAGHGVQIGGMNYMIPVDMSLTDPAQAPLQGVSLNSVVEQYMPGKAKLVFLDACRDNPLMASAGRGISKGLAPINVSEGTLIAYATKDGQVAEDGVGQSNSPFTAALLEHLADPDDIAVVLRTVRAKVMQRTNSRQQPWEYGSLTGGALVLSAIGPRR
jgi:hypothetical protein